MVSLPIRLPRAFCGGKNVTPSATECISVPKLHVAIIGAGGWAQQVARSGDTSEKKALALAIALSRRVSHPVADALTTLGDSLGQLQRIEHGLAGDGGLPQIDISAFRTETGKRPCIVRQRVLEFCLKCCVACLVRSPFAGALACQCLTDNQSMSIVLAVHAKICLCAS